MTKFSVLCIYPPSIPIYFNAGHHLPVWETGAYLRREIEDCQVDIVDAGVLNYSWKEILDIICNRYDLICILNEYDNVDGLRRMVEYSRLVSPTTKIITFGRASGIIPKFFFNYSVDAIVKDGDFECGVLEYIRFLRGEKSMLSLSGLYLLQDGSYITTKLGQFLDAGLWAFPPCEELPLDEYARISSRPENRFSALPGLKELTVSVARGCPIGCDYCLVPKYQGVIERRRSVESVIEYIKRCMTVINFDYVSMYAPTFTLKKNWTFEFCEAISKLNIKWKCCTSIKHLSKELIEVMAKSGCVRISVGLETLDEMAKQSLPKIKQIQDDQIRLLSEWCKNNNVELNCFVIVGMPNQTNSGLLHTFNFLTSIGAKIRPTVYTPYHTLSDSVSENDLSLFFTRQITKSKQISYSDNELTVQ
ncbi:MAG: radical SAM protein [Chitinophagaceae bacterium]